MVARLLVGAVLACPFVWSIPAGAQDEAALGDEAAYHTHEALTRLVRELAEAHPHACTVESIGRSRAGRDIWALQVALPGDVEPRRRPALLLAANIDGDHLVGSAVALGVAHGLLDRAVEGDDAAATFLTDHTLYVVPRVNPDAAEHFFDRVRSDWRRNLRPDDADRDGAVDEDPPDDLNGDGVITMMRVYDPEKADRMADADEPRLDATPDRDKGERAEFYVITEGRDDDGDGEVNEDAVGGVDLNMNYMHGYPFHDDGAGPYQVSEPESLALLTYVLERSNIAVVLVYGLHDNLCKPPDSKGSYPSGSPRGIDAKDAGFYGQISERFKAITGLNEAPGGNADGAFFAWAYAEFGVPSFTTPLWTRPEPEKKAEPGEGGDGGGGGGGGEAGEGAGEGARPDAAGPDEGPPAGRRGRGGPGRGGRGGRGGPGGPGGPGGAGGPAEPPGQGAPPEAADLTPSGIGDISQETIDELVASAEARGMTVTDDMLAQLTPEMVEGFAQRAGIAVRRVKASGGGGGASKNKQETAWLAYSDERGEGFVAWTPMEHPTLGHVEIGGWAPYFKTNPPADALPGLVDKQIEFVLELGGRFPRVSLGEPQVTRLAPGLYEVKAALVNEGYLPAGTAMAVRNRRARPYVVRVSLPDEQVVTGRRVNKTWSVPGSGGREDFRWILRTDDGAALTITVYSEKYGESETTIHLGQEAGR